jgi:hypothetical protein
MAQLSDQASAQQQNAQAENDAIQAGRTARDQAHQEELWQVEDTRTSEDAAYQQQKASLAERLTGLQSEKQAQDDLITTLQTMIGLMGQFGDAGTSALSQMVNAASSASSASSGYLNAESKSSYPTGGWIPKLAAGGTVPLGGEAIVGDAGIEHLRVTAQGAVVTPLTGSATGGAGGSVFNMPITINGSISADQIDALTQQFKSALQLAVKGVKNAGANQRRAVGA